MPLPDLRQDAKDAVKVVLDHQGLRTPILRGWFFRAARRFTPVLATEAGDVRFYVSTRDRVMGQATFMYRGFDESAMQHAVDELHTRTGRDLRGGTVLDVGGNFGTTSVYAVKRFGAARVLAFEPEPGNLELLRLNLAANDVADRVTVLAMAISDAEGEVELELSDENSGDHRVRQSAAAGAMGEASRTAIRVPARPLDALVEEGTVALDDVRLLWVDVQGHEAHVLAGATRLLDAGVPACIEYWPYGLERAGGLDRLHELIAARFSQVIDLGHPAAGAPARVVAPDQVAGLAARYPGPDGMCDLLLVP